MKEGKVSIIIPAYNIEKYIGGCLESAINQDYPNIEIIIVDDGSTDLTYSVCEKYKNKYRNIYLFHQKNQGVSAARNTGLKNATGDYIVFLDGDDALNYQYCSKMIERIERDCVDIVMCNAIFVDSVEEREKKTTKLVVPGSVETVLSREVLLQEFFKGRISGSSCEKIFRRKLIGNLNFVEGVKNNEDIYFTFNAFVESSRVEVLNDKLYICLNRDNSATRDKTKFSMDSSKVSQMIYEDTCRIFHENEQLKNLACRYFIVGVIFNIRILARKKMKYSERMKYFKELKGRLTNYKIDNTVLDDKRFRIEWRFIQMGCVPHEIFVRLFDMMK